MVTSIRSVLITTVMLAAMAGAVMGAGSEEVIINKFVQMYNLDTASYQINVLSNPIKTADVTPDQITLIPLSRKEPLGIFSIMVNVSRDDKKLESGQVRLDIMKFQEVVVVSDHIGRFDEMSVDKLMIQRMDITKLKEKPITSMSKVSGLRSRRNLRRGRILTTSAVEPFPDVSAGREVAIVFSDGLCRIAAVGIVMQEGAAGEYIKVKNKTSGKIIIARVVDETAVAVDL